MYTAWQNSLTWIIQLRRIASHTTKLGPWRGSWSYSYNMKCFKLDAGATHQLITKCCCCCCCFNVPNWRFRNRKLVQLVFICIILYPRVWWLISTNCCQKNPTNWDHHWAPESCGESQNLWDSTQPGLHMPQDRCEGGVQWSDVHDVIGHFPDSWWFTDLFGVAYWLIIDWFDYYSEFIHIYLSIITWFLKNIDYCLLDVIGYSHLSTIKG